MSLIQEFGQVAAIDWKDASRYMQSIACSCSATIAARAPAPFVDCPRCPARYALDWDRMTFTRVADHEARPRPAAPAESGSPEDSDLEDLQP